MTRPSQHCVVRPPYFSIAVLALYGDLIKRWIPTASLAILYLLAVGILVIMLIQGASTKVRLVGDAAFLNVIVIMLVGTYAVQLGTSVDSSLDNGLSHFLYMAVPLSFVSATARYGSHFDLGRLASTVLILMIPINIVGSIQYFIDPGFLVSTAYSDSGGVIARLFVGSEGVFQRYPSLFASADRYSAVGMMQFLFAVVLMNNHRASGWKYYSWVAYNFLTSFLALGVAGARSRILIVFVAVVFLLIFQVVSVARHRRTFLWIVTGVAGACLALTASALYVERSFPIEEVPILRMLHGTWTEGDVNVRVNGAVSVSILPVSASLFGAGLGRNLGKPGEFGIQSMWEESGIVWGSLLLLEFLALLFILLKSGLTAVVDRHGGRVVLYTLPILAILFGLLAGLTGAFELSSGMLLCCAIGASAQPAARSLGAGKRI